MEVRRSSFRLLCGILAVRRDMVDVLTFVFCVYMCFVDCDGAMVRVADAAVSDDGRGHRVSKRTFAFLPYPRRGRRPSLMSTSFLL